MFRHKFLEQPKNIVGILLAVSLLGILMLFVMKIAVSDDDSVTDPQFKFDNKFANADLIMRDGDPYIRALMRMISASEANDRQPYSLIYGGSRAPNLKKHPSKCITIKGGPNKGNCSTAAGRYQMINTTWYEMAKRYQAEQKGWPWDRYYSFAPLQQDRVVHNWLSDKKFWRMDIAQELRQGNLEKVRKRLSSTWTSLGYGIENNAVTPALAGIYEKVLKEELARTNSN